MNFSHSEIESRLPVWVALSELFLDTELNEITHKYIARIINESEYSAEEIENILWLEVFPAVGENLRITTGEWAGFDKDWLKNRILKVTSKTEKPFSKIGIVSVRTLINVILEEWYKVCHYLPSEYQDRLKFSKQLALKHQGYSEKKWWKFW